MKNIIVFGGSTSKASINKQLVTYTASLLSETAYKVLDLNAFEAPLYSIDQEVAFGFSENVEALNNEFAKANGFIVSLAEHNGSYAVGFKNLLDWLSRKEQKLFRNKPVLILATSPGKRGGASVLNLATNVFPYLGANVTGSFSLPSFNENFKEGKIQDADLVSELKVLVEAFEKEL